MHISTRLVMAYFLFGACNQAPVDYRTEDLAKGASFPWDRPTSGACDQLAGNFNEETIVVDGFELCARSAGQFITAIMEPQLEPCDASLEGLDRNEDVFWAYDGTYARAYPIAQLEGHELVNEWFGGHARPCGLVTARGWRRRVSPRDRRTRVHLQYRWPMGERKHRDGARAHPRRPKHNLQYVGRSSPDRTGSGHLGEDRKVSGAGSTHDLRGVPRAVRGGGHQVQGNGPPTSIFWTPPRRLRRPKNVTPHAATSRRSVHRKAQETALTSVKA